MVLLLIENGADVNIVNVEGKTAVLAAKGNDIRQLIKGKLSTVMVN